MTAMSPKKVAAVLAAVLEHAAELQAPAGFPDVTAGIAQALPCAASLPLWALAGRHAAMTERALWQRRLAKSW